LRAVTATAPAPPSRTCADFAIPYQRARAWPERPQSCAALNLCRFSADAAQRTAAWRSPIEINPDRQGTDMPTTVSLPRNNRQLVFTSSQAARYLGVSLATIRRWTDAGYVSCYRTPGGQRRFAREQLDAFVTSMRREGRVGQAGADSAGYGAHGGERVA
jgi:excisionase family DNA binding protein